jgi:hypothetical protein
MMIGSNPAASNTVAADNVFCAKPPPKRRDAMLRMNTPGSACHSVIRIRSPSVAPPVNGLDGSIAITATFAPASRYDRIISLTSVDLPPPGGPVTPIRCALPE